MDVHVNVKAKTSQWPVDMWVMHLRWFVDFIHLTQSLWILSLYNLCFLSEIESATSSNCTISTLNYTKAYCSISIADLNWGQSSHKGLDGTTVPFLRWHFVAFCFISIFLSDTLCPCYNYVLPNKANPKPARLPVANDESSIMAQTIFFPLWFIHNQVSFNSPIRKLGKWEWDTD